MEDKQLALIEMAPVPGGRGRRGRRAQAELERHRRHIAEARAIVRAARARARARELAQRQAGVRHLAEVRRRATGDGRGPGGDDHGLTPAA
ncbi:MAG: hypothetical protein D6683_12340 [Actinomyces sp.]|nr:MAG: hypothetical protein D6683_12340 [Actinomyces sp.]